MNEERLKILNMLKEGKITVEDAERLLAVLGNGAAAESGKAGDDVACAKPENLRVMVLPLQCGNGELKNGEAKVDVRIPLSLIRAGMKLGSFLPKQAVDKIDESLQKKGINMSFSNFKGDGVEELITALAKLTVDIEDGKNRVKVCCE